MSQLRTNFEAAGAEGISDDLNPSRINLFWHKEHIGSFSIHSENKHSIIEWHGFENPVYEKLFQIEPETGAPWFVVNAFPNNNMYEDIGNDTQEAFLSSGSRHLSNISYHPIERDNINILHIDRLDGSLSEHTENGIFKGQYILPADIKNINKDSLSAKFSKLWTNIETPRYSGAEIKLPAHLSADGKLTGGTSQSFTHFIKFPNDDMQEGLGLNEWICLELSDKIGLQTASHALLELPNGLPPALIIERFDISKKNQDKPGQRLMTQDFCTLDHTPAFSTAGDHNSVAKGSVETIGKRLRALSTAPEEDARNFYKRNILSWAVGDKDMHRKNLSMVFEYQEGSDSFHSARLSPTYDVTSQIMKRADRRNMRLTMQGRNDKFTKKQWVGFAETLGIGKKEALEILKDTMETLMHASMDIAPNLPDIAKKHPSCVFTAQRIATMVKNNVLTLGLGIDVPEWEDTKPPKRLRSIERGRNPVKFDYIDYIRKPSP